MRSLLIAAGALFALALGAQADSITLSAEASGTVGGDPIYGMPQIWTADLPQFDPALGTLDSVDISVDGWHTGTFVFTNVSGGGKRVKVNYIDYSFEINAFGASGGNLIFEPWVTTPTPEIPWGAPPGHWNLPLTGTIAVGTTYGPVPFGTQRHADYTYAPADANFSAFVGTGTLPFEIKDWAVFEIMTYGSGAQSWSLNSNCGVHVDATYHYTVPEPAALALLSVAALLLRRR